MSSRDLCWCVCFQRVNVERERESTYGSIFMTLIASNLEDFEIRIAKQWLALVGMKEQANTLFQSLSYGEQRLVLIARALVKCPALLILDEPTQGLDEINRHRLLNFLEHIAKMGRSTILFVSHRKDEFLPLFQQHVHLQ